MCHLLFISRSLLLISDLTVCLEAQLVSVLLRGIPIDTISPLSDMMNISHTGSYIID